MTRVKVCGITRHEDAELAVGLGAWALGFILWPHSPRAADPDVAAGIGAALRRRTELVGVFVNATLDEVAQAAEALHLSHVQLHGDEGPVYCAEVARRTGAKVIKAVRVAGPADFQDLERFHTDFHMLDTAARGLRGGTGETWDWALAARRRRKIPVILSGGLNAENVAAGIEAIDPWAVDVVVRRRGGARDQGPRQARRLHGRGGTARPDAGVRGGGRTVTVVEHRFGRYGGQYVPETLMPALAELEAAWIEARADPEYLAELARLGRDFCGRPTPLYHAERLSEAAGRPVWLKREDLMHTGSHKLNNALGQCVLAKRMGKPRIIAETGAGQHGVATATACALLGLECVVYMGTEDMRRQRPNVQRMELLGATVSGVDAGSRTLKEAVSAAIRDWVANVGDTHYAIGSCVGPAPFPALVRDLQRVIGDEARAQVLERCGRLPSRVIACVGGGSNAIGMFIPFAGDPGVELIGVEAAGDGLTSGRHGAPLTVGGVGGRGGVLHGSYSAIMQDEDGQITEAHSISAGLDYPGVGPEHAALRDSGRARYEAVTDEQALAAFRRLAELEGIIPALESSHAVAWVLENGAEADALELICLSGRGDKDLAEVLERPA